MVSVNKLQTAFPRRALWALGTHPRCGPKGRHVRKTHFHFPAFPRVSLRELLDLCMIFCGGAGGTSPPPPGCCWANSQGTVHCRALSANFSVRHAGNSPVPLLLISRRCVCLGRLWFLCTTQAHTLRPVRPALCTHAESDPESPRPAWGCGRPAPVYPPRCVQAASCPPPAWSARGRAPAVGDDCRVGVCS